MLPKQTAITFETLSILCPELLNIQADAQRTLRNQDDVALYWDKYEELKSKIKAQVGWIANLGLPDFVYTSEAYDCAHKAIFGETR